MATKSFNKPKIEIAPEMQFFSRETIEAIENKEEIEIKEKSTEEKVDVPEVEEKIKKSVIKEDIPKGYKLNPMYVETKSKRVQLVLQPSLYTRVKKAAKKQGLSINEFCHRVLDEATE